MLPSSVKILCLIFMSTVALIAEVKAYRQVNGQLVYDQALTDQLNGTESRRNINLTSPPPVDQESENVSPVEGRPKPIFGKMETRKDGSIVFWKGNSGFSILAPAELHETLRSYATQKKNVRISNFKWVTKDGKMAIGIYEISESATNADANIAESKNAKATSAPESAVPKEKPLYEEDWWIKKDRESRERDARSVRRHEESKRKYKENHKDAGMFYTPPYPF